MNKHLKLIKEVRGTEQEEHLSDMDIVGYQALLMEEGSSVFKAIKAGEMVDILSGLINLAYRALEAIAKHGGDVIDRPVTWRHDGFVVSIMTILSDHINHCSSGSLEAYSDVYCLSVHLTRSFINADFDKAFQMVHAGKQSKSTKKPDLSDCLFE